MMTNPHSSGPEIELYADEYAKAITLWADLQRKYGEKPTLQVLQALMDEAEDRFFNEVGLIVEFGDSDLIPTPSGQEVFIPSLHVVGRADNKPFDFERVIRETQLGHFDGKPGTITDDGRLVEPKKLM
jgi:hypothetical protein